MAGFGEFAISLQVPKMAAVGAKWPIVSGVYLKYSRFPEIAPGDWVGSGLHGEGGSELPFLAAEPEYRRRKSHRHWSHRVSAMPLLSCNSTNT
jgi:hypothetical protein